MARSRTANILIVSILGAGASSLVALADTSAQAAKKQPSVASASKQASAAAPSPDPAAIARWVRELGAGTYSQREEASRNLAAIGVPAKKALIEALAAEDAEVRRRARELLARVCELDFRDRLEAFVADLDGHKDPDLPCWAEYRELVGNHSAARQLFAEMQRSEGALLDTVQVSPQKAGGLLDQRCADLQRSFQSQRQNSRRETNIGSVAALLFIGGMKDVSLSAQAVQYVAAFCNHQSFQQAARSGERATLLHKLMTHWIEQKSTESGTAAYQMLMLAVRYDLPGGLKTALAMLKDKSVAPHMRQYAILAVAKFGNRGQIAALEPLLADESVCTQRTINKRAFQTQVRDVALVAVIRLSGEDPKQFGFEHARTNTVLVYDTSYLGFDSDEARAAAFESWQEHSKSPLGQATTKPMTVPATP